MNFALAGAGRVSASFVARLPHLAVELGPVAAQSYRLASRIVNSIKAGRPVRRYSDLVDAPLILICAPADGVPLIVSNLTSALECRRKTVLLCDAGVDSAPLAPLRSQGAAVGSIQSIPGFDGRRFVAEGDRAAVRQAKNLVGQLGARVEEVAADKMAIYAAGLSFGTSLFTPLMEAALQCFLEAGMSKASAAKVVEVVFQRSIRGYGYAGKRSWSGPLASGDLSEVRREIDALAASKGPLAAHYRQAADFARQILAKS